MNKKRKFKKINYHVRNAILICISFFCIYNVAKELSTTKQLSNDINDAKALAAQIGKGKRILRKTKRNVTRSKLRY